MLAAYHVWMYGDRAGLTVSPDQQAGPVCLLPLNIINLPMQTTNPFMCTVVRLRWGHVPSYELLCISACVDCLFPPDLIKAKGTF